ncbi:MAG: hypothetical protein U9R56_00785, partial [candidate division Zixibacteria bacterium]|nr:hypothetical protein [candidate division Zixibacteria bacterium]
MELFDHRMMLNHRSKTKLICTTNTPWVSLQQKLAGSYLELFTGHFEHNTGKSCLHTEDRKKSTAKFSS